MLTTTATVLAGLIGVGIILIGFRFLLRPQASAADFGGRPMAEAGAPWLWVKGVRDITSGLVIFVVLLSGDRELLGWLMLACSFTPFGDAAIVLRGGGTRIAAYAVHAGTALVACAIALVLLLA
ncbi:DUF4267 domain-containing protein [Streptomyces hoynatensis]|uniref:DUF4267 domain-containing protein n=1 Tax=Streptomyces hoynatensis TaxID=1141874 RepID=A0A3A9ZDW6_9ACTN|nr:DUF4267 domain-containing protein [Streptomyces hoynatensis]RKN45904.1 DUF4267 domain-containing protein [Streptomyces hoynatensis]